MSSAEVTVCFHLHEKQCHINVQQGIFYFIFFLNCRLNNPFYQSIGRIASKQTNNVGWYALYNYTIVKKALTALMTCTAELK